MHGIAGRLGSGGFVQGRFYVLLMHENVFYVIGGSLGTAAFRDAGTTANRVLLLDGSGRLPNSVLPTIDENKIPDLSGRYVTHQTGNSRYLQSVPNATTERRGIAEKATRDEALAADDQRFITGADARAIGDARYISRTRFTFTKLGQRNLTTSEVLEIYRNLVSFLPIPADTIVSVIGRYNVGVLFDEYPDEEAITSVRRQSNYFAFAISNTSHATGTHLRFNSNGSYFLRDANRGAISQTVESFWFAIL